MTKTTMDLSELLAKHDQGDFLRGIAEAVLQLIMETDVEGIIGAGRHERSGERTTWRNGYRERALDTRLGTLNLRVPKLRQGVPAAPSRASSRSGRLRSRRWWR
jgi:putative transposase